MADADLATVMFILGEIDRTTYITALADAGRLQGAADAVIISLGLGSVASLARVPNGNGWVTSDMVPDVPNRTPATGSVADANFAQNNRIPPTKEFTLEGSQVYSDLAGRPINTVGDRTDALRSGAIRPNQIPVDFVDMNGTRLILNTRTSTALTNAGIPQSQWFGRNQTGAEAFPGKTFDQLARDQLRRNGLPPTGAPNLPGGQ